MPKLKKYSQKETTNQQSNTNISLGQYQINESDSTPPIKHESPRQQKSNQRSFSSSSSPKSQHQYSNSKFQNSNQISKKQKHSPNHKGRKQKKTTEKKNNKSKYDADQILRKAQEDCAKYEEDEIKQYGEQDQTGINIPDDALVGFEDNKNGKKKERKIKLKNKFFDAVILDESNQQFKKIIPEQEAEQLRILEQEHKNILASRNQKNSFLMEERKTQIELRVDKIRQRLNFKNAYEDIRFKEQIKQTLRDVKDCEQVQIQIEPPKIFKGSTARHTDAALFIKNLSHHQHYCSQPQLENSVSRSLQKENNNFNNKNKNRKIDRKQFYQEFTRQIKETKAVEIPIQTNELFKKSSLDQLQNEFETHQHLFKQDENSRHSRNSLPDHSDKDKAKINRLSSRLKMQMAANEDTRKSKIQVVQQDVSNEDSKVNKKSIERSSIQNRKSDNQNASLKRVKQKISENQKDKTIGPQQLKQRLYKQKNSKSKSKGKGKGKSQVKVKIKNQERKQKEKNKGEKNLKSRPKENEENGQRINKGGKNKQVSKKIKELFQQEAEDSQNGYGDDGHSSEENDDSSVESIIDRNQVKYVLKNEREARKKYMADQMKKDEEILRKIKQKITQSMKIKCEESSESKQRRKQRIREMKKKFEEEDENDEKNEESRCDEKQQQKNQDAPSDKEFSKQLQDLQQEILKKQGFQKQIQVMPSSQVVHKRKKSIWQQMNITTSKPQATINQEKRGGFLNNSKAIRGNKIQAPKKSVSKPKNITF